MSSVHVSKQRLILSGIVMAVVLAGCATRPTRDAIVGSTAGCPAPWSYTGITDPSNWSSLSSDYAQCAGPGQSPINIVAYTKMPKPVILTQYRAVPLIVQNTSRTFQVGTNQGGSMTRGLSSWTLLQFHFHTPSEHTINGIHAPAELHLVHTNSYGTIGVIGVLILESDDDNPALANLIASIPQTMCATSPQNGTIDPTTLLPSDLDYFLYGGSLTTPPCSTTVSWFVLQHPITASNAQIQALSVLGANNRPIQTNNSSPVLLIGTP